MPSAMGSQSGPDPDPAAPDQHTARHTEPATPPAAPPAASAVVPALPTPEPASSAGANIRGGEGWVLRHAHFRNVWLAACVSNCGNWMESFGMQNIVADRTGSLVALAWLTAAQNVPIFLFGLLGGVLADRVNRRTLLVVTQGLLMLVSAGVTAVSLVEFDEPDGVVWWLIALGAINGTVMALNTPAWQVLTPRLVPRAELTKAITLNGIQFNLARVIGPMLAGALMPRFGPTPLFVVNTLSFLGVMIVVMRTPDSPAPPSSGRSAWGEIAEAGRFLFFRRATLAVFLAILLVNLMAGPLVRILPLFVHDVYGLDQTRAKPVVGQLLAMLGVGAVGGGFLLRLVPRWYPRHHLIPTAVSGLGLAITLFAVLPEQWAGTAAMGLVGVFWIWGFNQSWATLQHLSPDRMRGRVMAIATMAGFGAIALGAAASARAGEWLKDLLDDQLGTQLAVVCLSLPLMLAGVVMLLFRVPEIDGMPRPARPTRSLIDGVLAREHWPK